MLFSTCQSFQPSCSWVWEVANPQALESTNAVCKFEEESFLLSTQALSGACLVLVEERFSPAAASAYVFSLDGMLLPAAAHAYVFSLDGMLLPAAALTFVFLPVGMLLLVLCLPAAACVPVFDRGRAR